MEYQKFTNLSGNIPDKVPKFITKKWIEVYDQSGNAEDRYKPRKQIKFKKSILQSDLCDCSDAYIVVKVTIIVVGAGDRDKYNRNLVFKNNAPFISCISKIYNTLIVNAKDLDIVMPMYKLSEYSKNYSKTSGSLWNYYRDEPNNPPDDNYNADPITNSESFKHKRNIRAKTALNRS